MPYAHAFIELADGTKYDRGDEVPAPVAKDEPHLVEFGSISDEPYDPKADESPMPDVVEIEGVTYIAVSDGAKESADVRRA